METPADVGDGQASPARARTRRAIRMGRFVLHALDFAIALGRKVAGFCALLTLGWIYFRLLFLGHGLDRIHAGAPDPDLRQTLWVALLLIMAQGWDIPTDQIAAYWGEMRAALPPRPAWPMLTAPPARRALPGYGIAEPVVVHLGRFMDLCVAIANKLGAFAVLLYLLVLAEQFGIEGATVKDMYPTAADPTVSFMADLTIYVAVLGWWAMPFEQIAIFWRRLRGREGRHPIEPTSER